MTNKQLRVLCKVLLACAELIAGVRAGWISWANFQSCIKDACERIDEDLVDE